MTLQEALELRKSDVKTYERRAKETMAEHVRTMLEFQEAGAETFDYGNNIRAYAKEMGVENAFDFLASYQPISVHYSAKEKDHSAGQHYRETLRIFIKQISLRRKCLQRMKA